jgi:hypothetical protein
MEAAEIELRREAAQRRLAGGRRAQSRAISVAPGGGWPTWAARHDPDDPGWARGQSWSPRPVPNRTPMTSRRGCWR